MIKQGRPNSMLLNDRRLAFVPRSRAIYVPEGDWLTSGTSRLQILESGFRLRLHIKVRRVVPLKKFRFNYFESFACRDQYI